jgi:hypothetical protein
VKKSQWSSFDRFKAACEAAVQLVLADGFARCKSVSNWREPLDGGDVAYLFRFEARKAPQEGRQSPAEHRTVRVRFVGPAHTTLRADFVVRQEGL